MSKNVLSFALVLSIALSLGMTIKAQRVGGYKPASVDDKQVVAAANFAVNKQAETNSEQEGLSLDSIQKAERQVVAGTNFRLCLAVSLDEETQLVRTVVYQNLKQEYTLGNWEVVESCK